MSPPLRETVIPPADPVLDPLLKRGIFPMIKLGGTFVLPHGTGARSKIPAEGGYGADFGPFLENLLEVLAGPEWPAGSYYPGGWYRSLQAQGEDPARAIATPENLRPFTGDPLRVDETGRWWLGGKEIRGRVRRYFLQHLERDPRLGLYRVRYPIEEGEEVQYLEAGSPPLRVEGINGEGDTLRMRLNDGSELPFDPAALRLDESENLHCPVPERGLTARFSGRARWRILDSLEPAGSGWSVEIGGRRIPLKESGEGDS